jgi:glycine cleavage system transcriptional repressor
MPHAILTAIGSDRPGLVDEVSQFIFTRKGNIEDSRMVNLRGQFAMMVLVGADADALGKLAADLPQLSAASGLQTTLHDAKSPGEASSGKALAYRLKGTALDQPGMVHRISHLLRDFHVNIESLDTHLTPAPYTGAPMFEMELVCSLPSTASVSQLRQKLGALCDELNIDWTLEPA